MRRSVDVHFKSAPALKNRPAPVMTVKTVVGCSFSSLTAATQSAMRLPPNVLSRSGRLSFSMSMILIY